MPTPDPVQSIAPVYVSTKIPEPVQPIAPVYVSAKIGARMFSLSSSSWYRHVADGRLPQPGRFVGSARWKRADVIAAFEAAAERDAA